jgi:hypothetical protein
MPAAEELKEIGKLPMEVSKDIYWSFETEENWIMLQNFDRFRAKPRQIVGEDQNRTFRGRFLEFFDDSVKATRVKRDGCQARRPSHFSQGMHANNSNVSKLRESFSLRHYVLVVEMIFVLSFRKELKICAHTAGEIV